MPELCDHCLRTPSDETPRIQEGHIALGHTICWLIERAIFPRDAAGAPHSAGHRAGRRPGHPAAQRGRGPAQADGPGGGPAVPGLDPGRPGRPGFERVVLAVGYRHEAIEQHFGAAFGGWRCTTRWRPSRWAPAAPSAWRRALAEPGRSSCSTATPSWTSTTGPCSPRTPRGAERMSMAVCKVRDAGRYGALDLPAAMCAASARRARPAPASSMPAPTCSTPTSWPDSPRRGLLVRAAVAPARGGALRRRVRDRGLFIDIGVPEDYARAQTLWPRAVRRHGMTSDPHGARRRTAPRRRCSWTATASSTSTRLRPPHRGLRVRPRHLRAVPAAARRGLPRGRHQPGRHRPRPLHRGGLPAPDPLDVGSWPSAASRSPASTTAPTTRGGPANTAASPSTASRTRACC